jgi:hypothetical protein
MHAIRIIPVVLATLVWGGCVQTPHTVRLSDLISTAAPPIAGPLVVSFPTTDSRLNLGAKPITKAKAAGSAAISGGTKTLTAFAGTGGYGELFGLLVAPVVAIGAGTYGAVAGVGSTDLEAATHALESARGSLHPELEIQARLHNERAGLLGTASQPLENPSAAPGVSEIPLHLQLLDCGFTDGNGINPAKRLRLRVGAEVPATGANLIPSRAYVQFESEDHDYTEWAANDARLLRTEWQRAVASVAQQLVDWTSGKAIPPPIRRVAD